MFTRDVFRDEEAPAFALLYVTLKKYGLPILDVEPELIRKTIESDYGFEISDLQHDKLQAAILVLTTDWFETDWVVFEHCCQLFSGQATDHTVVNTLEPEQIAIGLSEVMLIRDESLTYDDEIRAYVGMIFAEYGCSKAPSIFPTAIMPKTSDVDDKDLNDALKEVFETHAQTVLDYVEKIDT